MDLMLRLPSAADEAEVRRAFEATSSEVPNFLHHYDPAMSFARYIDVLRDQERGVGLAPGQVASTFLLAFADARVVGRVAIRHRLNAALEESGGHIGFVVVPEFRRRGCATEMLRRALVIARGDIGLQRVLLTCDDDNVASRRTIEKNGGVLETTQAAPNGTLQRRYWIELGG